MGIQYALQCLLLPPGIFILLLLVAVILLYFRRRMAITFLLVAISGMYLLSIPSMPPMLAKHLQIFPPLKTKQIQNTQAQAIVVLSAGRYFNAPEYGGDTASTITLLRLRYAAYLHHLKHLPILLSGGAQSFGAKPDAVLMQKALWNGFGIKARWLETKSANTWSNAVNSVKLLRKNHIKRILLVTSAKHMRRAMLAFRHQHIKVIAAPTFFIKKPYLKRMVNRWLPNRFALFSSTQCLYEYAGLLWYHIAHVT